MRTTTEVDLYSPLEKAVIDYTSGAWVLESSLDTEQGYNSLTQVIDSSPRNLQQRAAALSIGLVLIPNVGELLQTQPQLAPVQHSLEMGESTERPDIKPIASPPKAEQLYSSPIQEDPAPEIRDLTSVKLTAFIQEQQSPVPLLTPPKNPERFSTLLVDKVVPLQPEPVSPIKVQADLVPQIPPQREPASVKPNNPIEVLTPHAKDAAPVHHETSSEVAQVNIPRAESPKLVEPKVALDETTNETSVSYDLAAESYDNFPLLVPPSDASAFTTLLKPEPIKEPSPRLLQPPRDSTESFATPIKGSSQRKGPARKQDKPKTSPSKGNPDFVFPLDTTYEEITQRPSSKRWCYASSTGCHHGGGQYRNAEDIHADPGTPVLLPVDARIVATRDQRISATGSRVHFKDKKGNLWYVAHLAKGLTVHEGQTLEAGHVIGYLGDSSRAMGTDPHVHLEKLPPRYHLRPSCKHTGCAHLGHMSIHKELKIALESLPHEGKVFSKKPPKKPTTEPAPVPPSALIPPLLTPPDEGVFTSPLTPEPVPPAPPTEEIPPIYEAPPEPPEAEETPSDPAPVIPEPLPPTPEEKEEPEHEAPPLLQPPSKERRDDFTVLLEPEPVPPKEKEKKPERKKPKPQEKPQEPSGLTGNRKIGYEIVSKQYGWTGSEWKALDKLWHRESNWNNNAQNPTSTAFGIAQFLDSTWGIARIREAGCEKTSDAAEQIRCGAIYIKGRYGTPKKAWTFWQKQNPHWY